jgi:hypothetical protein
MQATSLYLRQRDRDNIKDIREKYGFRSDAEAVRWAAEVVNRQDATILLQFVPHNP